MKIWTVDAFAIKPYTGNPAAVMLVTEFPDNNICQKIAAEMNLSETAFAKQLSKNHYHLRWFTPKVEAKLCGHATLATAHILYENEIVEDKETIHFSTLSGSLFVSKNQEKITLNFPLQKTGPILELSDVKAIFGQRLVAMEKAYDDLIVELTDETAVRELDLSTEIIKSIDCRGLIVTAKGTDSYDFVSRFFAPRVGISEDPVTGSAHCKLADYWQKKLGKNKFLAYQASSRGGEIALEILDDRVLLTGKAITIMAGRWSIPSTVAV